MFLQISYYNILGLPLIAWLGIITYLVIIISAIIGHLFLKGKMKSGLKVHLVLSAIAIIFATLHAILGIGNLI